MGKRKRRRRRKRTEPSLFDLPLQSVGNEPDAVESDDDRPGGAQATVSSPEAPAIAGRASGQGPSILFDRNENNAELGTGKAELLPASHVPTSGGTDVGERPGARMLRDETPGARMPRDVAAGATPDDKAFVGDRLLGGLADLAAQLIALGIAIAATHSMGIIVTVADWMPFGVLALVFSFLYWSVPLAFWGQTPGMAWVGHIARSSSGEPLSFGQAFRRWFGSVLTLAFAGLPLLIALTGYSLTDRISGSRTTGR